MNTTEPDADGSFLGRYILYAECTPDGVHTVTC